MPGIGYLGYAKVANVFLLTTGGSLNRNISPIMSDGVWGAGWITAANDTNYADNQQHFEGSLTFELQGIQAVWNLFANWAINNRVFPQSAIISPDGLTVQDYSTTSDPRTGVWIDTAGFTVDTERPITLNCGLKALKRSETYSASTYRAVKVGPGIPTAPLNPSPFNRNPFPGWAATTQITWPGAPPYFTDTNPTGMFMMGSDWTYGNNTQIVKGCIGLPNPAAVIQGTMTVTGTMRLYRDGVIPDPYAVAGQPFTASGASIIMSFGTANPIPQFIMNHVLLTTEDFAIQGKNNLVPRVFGFTGLGDGLGPPLQMPLI